jgi:hypothetical protein
MNDTSTTVSWAPEPQERGTIGLVWSCFATIFICTWSAIHPNLPEIDESFFSVLERRITYLVAGLIAPEYIAWGAFGELQQAWKLKAQIAEKRSNVNQARNYDLGNGHLLIQILVVSQTMLFPPHGRVYDITR